MSRRAGYQVVVQDVLPSKLRQAAERLSDDPGVDYSTTIEDAVREADLVIDGVPDELESKFEILSLIDRMAPPRTIIATPTTLSIADLASCTYRPERCLGLRLPPLLASKEAIPGAPVVDLVRTPSTGLDVLAAMLTFWRSLGCDTKLEIDHRQLS